MDKTLERKIENFINTLPIGLYVGRRVPCSLTKDRASCYNPDADAFEISSAQISKGLETAKEENFETMVRTNFYHEVSHAILTPQCLGINELNNIFEDERIETLLKDYYYGVDFKGMKKHLTGYDEGYPITDSLSAFFALVRFRKGKPHLVKRVEELIEKYKTLTRESGRCEYERDIRDLYKEIAKETDTPEKIEEYLKSLDKMEEERKKSKGKGKGKTADKTEEEGKGGGGGETEEESDTEGEGYGEGEGEDDGEENENESPLSAEEIKKLMAESTLNPRDEKFYQTLLVLFQNYKKKNSKGSAFQGYSGVLNPRLADRKDYRIFERSATARGNNQFGSFHLNIFIDTSGSFSYNDNTVNSLIRALTRIEKQNHTFTFDIITTGAPSKEKVLPKENRLIHSSGGNHLSKQIFDIFRKQQYPMTYNYNIILFDGDAYSNDCSIPLSIRLHDGEGFKAFANNNCTIVSDEQNRKYIEKYCPTTKTVYTNNYCAELFDNIVKIMQRALS